MPEREALGRRARFWQGGLSRERLGVAGKLRVRGRIATRPVQAGGDPVIHVTHWAQGEVV